MNRLAHKTRTVVRRRHRNRNNIYGTEQRPRLSVNISLRHVSAQIINDQTGKTLAYVSTIGLNIQKDSLSQKAELVGKDLALKANKLGIKKVVFDRGAKLYHGRVERLANAARKEGLEF